MNFSNEMIEKAKKAASAEELLEMAKAEGVELTAEEAEQYFSFLHTSRQLSDEELETVAGGKGGGPKPKYKAGQRVIYYPPHAGPIYGTIESCYYSDFQEAFYYWVQMDNGEKMKFPLESDICPAKVIS